MITLTGDQDHAQFKPSSLAEDVDATGGADPNNVAVFHVRQSPAFLYPVDIRNTSGRTWTGGKWIADDISQTTDWSVEYAEGNSGAFRLENNQNFTALNVWMDGIWDGFRPAGTECDGWLIQGWLGENIRDDFVEDDGCNSGTIRDCLVDGAYVSCISTTNGTSTTKATKTITIEDSLFKAKAYLVDGVANMHGAPFKANKDSVNNNPTFIISNTTFAILRPDHNMGPDAASNGGTGSRLAYAFQNMTVTNSYWLNLSDTPISALYESLIPAGFTLLQGQAARDLWEQKRSAWRVAHGYDEAPPSGGPTTEEFNALVARVDALETAVADLTAANAAQSATIAALQASVSALEVSVPALSGIVNDHIGAISNLDDRVAALEAVVPPDVSALEARVAAVEGKIVAASQALA